MTRTVAPRHRARPRYARILAFGTALGVTLVTVAAGVGILPTESQRAYAAADRDRPGSVALAGAEAAVSGTVPLAGTGRRIVFDESAQRVWLVKRSGEVARSYLVSGSVTDNLQPGTYEVYSRSRWAVGVDDSGVMEYFVRFTRGDNAAIGFHSIPTKNGRPLQSKSQLGTPASHGCIRQDLPDAIALWKFAPVGTTVVVTA